MFSLSERNQTQSLGYRVVFFPFRMPLKANDWMFCGNVPASKLLARQQAHPGNGRKHLSTKGWDQSLINPKETHWTVGVCKGLYKALAVSPTIKIVCIYFFLEEVF